jgi:hypothetical protein
MAKYKELAKSNAWPGEVISVANKFYQILKIVKSG